MKRTGLLLVVLAVLVKGGSGCVEHQSTPHEPDAANQQDATTPTRDAATEDDGGTCNGPRITSVSGILSHGEPVIIVGNCFGVGDTDILLWDDFEDGADGADLVDIPQVGLWDVGISPRARYLAGDSRSGAQSAYAARGAGSTYSNFEVDYDSSSDNTLYLSFWFKINSDGSGQEKLNQIWGNCWDDPICTNSCGDYSPGIMTGSSGGEWFSYVVSDEPLPPPERPWPADECHPCNLWYIPPSNNQWHHYEITLRQSTPDTPDGLVDVRIDGVSVNLCEETATRVQGEAHWYLFTFLVGLTNFASPNETWIDDAYFNNSWARVVLGNHPDYENCTELDIQPVDWEDPEWSDSEVRVRFNQADYGPSETAHLFVIDARGNVSPSFAVSVGP